MPFYSGITKETTATTGTGTVALAGAASGFIAFPVAADGQTIDYCLQDNNGGKEEGRGVFTDSGRTLTRDTVFYSTNGGAKINLSGVAEVFITISSYEMTYLPAKIAARVSLRI